MMARRTSKHKNKNKKRNMSNSGNDPFVDKEKGDEENGGEQKTVEEKGGEAKEGEADGHQVKKKDEIFPEVKIQAMTVSETILRHQFY